MRENNIEARPLVYDIGLHTGEDTAYYLKRGYRVVAVEANPLLCTRARKQFADEIDQGRLVLCNVAVSDEDGPLEFWVASGRTQFSSLYREAVEVAGVEFEQIVVEGMRFDALVARYGVPRFVKIDIEGADILCLRQLSPEIMPNYLSFEMTTEVNEGLEILSALGYSRFKVVRQNDFKVLRPYPAPVERFLASGGEIHRFCRRVEFRVQRTLNRIRYPGWNFPFGASGPVSDELLGTWIDAEAARTISRRLRQINLGPTGRNEWFDFHAAI